MKKLLKGMMGVASLAAVGAGVFYLTKKLLEDQTEDMEEDFDDVSDFEEDEDSREYVTLDIDEEEIVSGEDIAENEDIEADTEEVMEEDIAETEEAEAEVEEEDVSEE